MKIRRRLFEFIWDKGNEKKNWEKHRVSKEECIEAFFDRGKQEYPDPDHSQKETRKIFVGKTKKERILFIVYTLRENAIRIISARDLNKKKEVDLYEKAPKTAKI